MAADNDEQPGQDGQPEQQAPPPPALPEVEATLPETDQALDAVAPPLILDEPVGRPAPRRPGSDTEKALGLEVARLFGLSPRLLVNPEPAAAARPPVEVAVTEEADLPAPADDAVSADTLGAAAEEDGDEHPAGG